MMMMIIMMMIVMMMKVMKRVIKTRSAITFFCPVPTQPTWVALE